MKNNIKDIHDVLTQKLKIYINAIIREYGRFIPKDRLMYLENIKDYSKIINIHNFNSINGYASSNMIHMPLSALDVFNEISKLPNYGIDKNHKTYDNSNLIINNNTFLTYLNHLIVSGATLEDYFEDLLLHEVMHFCGSGGSISLKEGINEFLTRKLALKYGFKTSGCGYPKEVFIVSRLADIFKEDTIIQIAFINDEKMIFDFLKTSISIEAAFLYKDVLQIMEKEFFTKYYSHMNEYNQTSGVISKIKNYDTINYDKVNKIIDKYEHNKKQIKL